MSFLRPHAPSYVVRKRAEHETLERLFKVVRSSSEAGERLGNFKRGLHLALYKIGSRGTRCVFSKTVVHNAR
jgi:hypothetical protein